MPLDVHYLEVFKAVLSECSMSQAAARLHTSASNVRRIVSALEQELGVPLFDREARGKFQPTNHADRLNREMAGFMKEMESLQQFVLEIREAGRVLKLGAQRWLLETAYFVRFFNFLRQDRRFRPVFLEVGGGQERAMLEAGACDVYVGLAVPGSKRLAGTPLAPLPLSFGSLDPDFVPEDPTRLAKVSPWGLHLPDKRLAGHRLLQTLERTGGGTGRALETSYYREWAFHPADDDLRGMLSPEPAEGAADPRLHWQALPFLPPIPIRATFLTQHPYGFLENALQCADSKMTSHEPSV